MAIETAEESKAQPAGPCLMVIFGASGDLTKRKLIPALYNLSRSGHLPENFAVIGFAFDAMDTAAFRDTITREAHELSEAPIEPESWARFVERLNYMQGNFDNPADYEKLKGLLAECQGRHQSEGNCLYYLATSPT